MIHMTLAGCNFLVVVLAGWLLLGQVIPPANGQRAWDMTAIVIAVFAGSGPALIANAITWLKARAAHTLAARTFRVLKEVRKLLEENKEDIAEKAPLFARILALLEKLDQEK